MKRKIDDVESKKREIEKLLSETEKALHIAQESLYEREKRQGLKTNSFFFTKKFIFFCLLFHRY
jgi:hypothetical protein